MSVVSSGVEDSATDIETNFNRSIVESSLNFNNPVYLAWEDLDLRGYYNGEDGRLTPEGYYDSRVEHFAGNDGGLVHWAMLMEARVADGTDTDYNHDSAQIMSVLRHDRGLTDWTLEDVAGDYTDYDLVTWQLRYANIDTSHGDFPDAFITDTASTFGDEITTRNLGPDPLATVMATQTTEDLTATRSQLISGRGHPWNPEGWVDPMVDAIDAELASR